MKKHFEENKKFYIGIACGVALAGITWLIVRERYAAIAQLGRIGPSTAESSVAVRPLSFFSNRSPIVTVVHSGDRGHPGFRVRNLETGEEFVSQTAAAKAFGISQSNLSNHLNGKYAHAEGLHFERITMAA